jgi:hypothetical protein
VINTAQDLAHQLNRSIRGEVCAVDIGAADTSRKESDNRLQVDDPQHR